MFYELLNEDEANDIENLSKELGTDYGLINKMLPVSSWRKIAKDRKMLQESIEEELVLVGKGKFFKKLPNNFTGTIEVENGYIVEKEILDKEEKEYLTNVIKPFKKNIKCIAKRTPIFEGKECIVILFKNDGIVFPYFKKGSMYKGMEPNKNYSLEKLNLKEVE